MGTIAIEEVTGRIAENLECLKRFTATPRKMDVQDFHLQKRLEMP